MEIKDILAANIRRYRLERKYTQRELADMLGVSPKTVSKWETGGGVPDTLQLVPLVGALSVSLDKLLLDPAPPPPQDWKDVFSRVTRYYGLTAEQVAMAAELTEAEAEAALANDLSAIPKEKRQLAGMVVALLAQTLPMFVEKKHILITNLWCRLRDECGLSYETVEKYAQLPPGKFKLLMEKGKELLPREEESLFVALFALERIFFGADCFPFE